MAVKLKVACGELAMISRFLIDMERLRWPGEVYVNLIRCGILVARVGAVSYTHLTLPTIYSV